MTPFEEFLQKIVLKQVEGSVYLLPAVTIDMIEHIKEKEKEAIINAYIQSQQDLSYINYGKKLTDSQLSCVKIEATDYYENNFD